jgi:uncharacterized protein YdhG (YjbR/CyaY superfamily)
MDPSPTSACPPNPAIDAYIQSFDEPACGRLSALRAVIAAELPYAVERMAYGLPTWHQGENLVHIGGFAKHVGFYPGPEAIVVFADRLAGLPTSKGAVQLRHDQPLPLDLVRDVTRWRLLRATQALAEKAERTAAKKRRPPTGAP